MIQNGQHETLANSPRVYREHMQELIKSKCVARSSDIAKEISDYINKGTEKKALLLPKAQKRMQMCLGKTLFIRRK